MRLASIVLIALLAGGVPSFGDDLGILIVQAKDHDDLNTKWCALSSDMEHILVLPASLFVDSQELICDGGPYKLYRIIEHDDPDDFEYYLDPPFGKENRLGCDGKAGREMEIIAVNCRPLKGN